MGTLAVGLFYHGGMFNIERIITQSIGMFVALIWEDPCLSWR